MCRILTHYKIDVTNLFRKHNDTVIDTGFWLNKLQREYEILKGRARPWKEIPLLALFPWRWLRGGN